MTPKAIESWKKVRSRGRYRYILFDGTVGFGMAMLVGLGLSRRPDTTIDWIVLAVICGAGGTGFGFFNWRHNERKYLAATQNMNA